MSMRFHGYLVAGWLLTGVLAAGAGEKLATLKVGDDVFHDVTITGTNATDVYFTYSGGMGNAKLRKLEPEMQKYFKFDAAKAAALEKEQAEARTQYYQRMATNHFGKPTELKEDRDLPPPTYDNGDVVAPKLYAKSYRGQKSPPIVVEQWFT